VSATADDLPQRRAPYDALATAAELRAEYVGASGYGLAYGSHADGTAHTASDLDLLLVGQETLTVERQQALIRDVIRLHERHGFGLDQEVSYSSKLHATAVEVWEAVALGGFGLTADGEVIVDPVIVEPWFLDSRAFKLRLVLNALTVPHVFLGGDAPLYERHREQAERSVTLLALSLVDSREVPTTHELLRALTGDPEGACGEDFLGYDEGPSRSPALFSLLQRGLSALAQVGVVDTPDGIRLNPNRAERRRRLRALHAPLVGV
jgi:hypothetical protein